MQASPAVNGLGERVRAARRERGLSQAQLAGDELTKGFISQVESGLVRPSVRSLQIIAARLGKSLDYFLGDERLTTTKRLAFHHLAAEAAAERQDWSAVREAADAALKESPQPAERAVLLRLLATAEMASGDREAAFEHIRIALSLLDPARDAHEIAQLLYTKGVAYFELGQLVAASEALEAGRDVIEKHEILDARLRARMLVALGSTYRRLHRTAKALSVYESALALATNASELRIAAQGYMGVAVALYDAGELDAAIGTYRRALDLLARVSDIALELSAMLSLAAVQFESGDIDASRETTEIYASRAALAGDQRVVAIADVQRARIALARQNAEEALRLAKSAERELARLGDDRQRADALRVIGAASDAMGAYAASDRAYRRAIELVRSIADVPDLATFASEYAKKLRARGEVDQAFHYLEMARAPQAQQQNR